MRLAVAFCLVCFLAAFAARADTGVSGVAQQRVEIMKSMGRSVKALAGYVQGRNRFDGPAIEALAGDIAAKGGEAMTKLFPKGSAQPDGGARPEIWQRWARFQALADELAAQGETMALTASGKPHLRPPPSGDGQGRSALGAGPSVMEGGAVPMPPQMAMRMNFMHLSSVCKDCHSEFRIKKQ